MIFVCCRDDHQAYSLMEVALANNTIFHHRIKEFILRASRYRHYPLSIWPRSGISDGDRSKNHEQLLPLSRAKAAFKGNCFAIMLADGCEARARAELPKTDEEYKILIRRSSMVASREGQLEDSNLTLKDFKDYR